MMIHRFAHTLLALLFASFAFAQDLSLGGSTNPSSETDRLQRIIDLAGQLQDPAGDPVPLFTELVRQIGFTIRSEEHAALAAPLGPTLRLAITDAEIRSFTEMFRNGDRVSLADLTASLDVFWHKAGIDLPCGPSVDEWRKQAFVKNAPDTRGLFTALQALGNQHDDHPDLIDQDGEVSLDPLQALLLVRVIGEDLMLPIRQAVETTAAGRQKPHGPFVDAGAAGTMIDWPGWAEDGYAGTVTTLVGKAIENIDKFNGKAGEWLDEALKHAPGEELNGAQKLGRGVSIANAIAAVAKCIATYTFLKGELRVEDPGQPLIRTRGGPAQSEAGERRTLVAKFWIDGAKATEWMKENRPIVALAGLDIDMPKSGALKGIETEWEIKEDRHSSKYHLIQLADAIDMSKVKADDQGEARLNVIGCPQPKDLSKMQVLPIEKTVPISVTPQVKSTEAQQDLVDAVFGALGILSVAEGNVEALLTPAIECLYRMKWQGGRKLTLRVRDWIPAEVVGEVDITVRASGSQFERERSLQYSVNRTLKFRDVKMAGGEFDVPSIDPMILQFMSAEQRKQMEAGLAQARKLARQPVFQMEKEGFVELHVHDRSTLNALFGECDAKPGTRTVTVDGDLQSDLAEPAEVPRQMSIGVDLDAKIATLNLNAMVKAKWHEDKVIAGRRTTHDDERPYGVFTDLELQGQQPNVIRFELKETANVVSGGIDYYGVTTVPFTFDNKHFKGSALVTFSLHRRPKPQAK